MITIAMFTLLAVTAAAQPIIITPGTTTWSPPVDGGIWKTDAGRRAVEMREQLRAFKLYDELKENWDEVRAALVEGCQHFVAGVSRIDVKRQRVYWRVMPVMDPANEHGWVEPWRKRR